MNMKALFTYLRKAPFGGSLSTAQVRGVTAILEECQKQGVTNIAFIAYILATAFHETGGKMAGIVENLRYTTAEGIRKTWPTRFKNAAAALPYVRQAVKLANYVYGGRMGNTKPGDGWLFRGRGLAQITGYTNYEKFGIAKTPDKALEIETAARIIVTGMLRGTFTGKKLSDYLIAGNFNPTGARAIINGTDKAKLITTHYVSFVGALEKASQAHDVAAPLALLKSVKEDDAEPDDVPAGESKSVLAIVSGLGVSGLSSLLAALTNPFALVGFALVLGVAAFVGYMFYTGKFKQFRK